MDQWCARRDGACWVLVPTRPGAALWLLLLLWFVARVVRWVVGAAAERLACLHEYVLHVLHGRQGTVLQLAAKRREGALTARLTCMEVLLSGFLLHAVLALLLHISQLDAYLTPLVPLFENVG